MKASPYAKCFVRLLLFICGVAAIPASAQTATRESVRNSLAEKAGFEAEDFSEIEKGRIVVKNLNTGIKREVAVIGVVKISAPNDVVLSAFNRTIRRQEGKTSKQSGSFSATPVPEDLAELTIEDREIDDLKNCRVNSCKWNLPANLIKRLASEIDWSAGDYRKRADTLIRKIIVEYAVEYSKNGDSALFEYNDTRSGVNLRDEYLSMQENMFWVNGYSPGLARFLETFPSDPPRGIKNRLNWSKVKIGLKPVIIITQNISFQQEVDGIPMAFVVSKQIYANHYFDSTLAETAVISFEGEGDEKDTYFMFLNRSRASAFTTALGRLARRIVEGQAESRLEAVLKDTRRYSALALANRDVGLAKEADSSIVNILTSTPFILGYILMAIALAAYLFVSMLRRQR